METIFSGIVDTDEDARGLAINFYGPIFLLYSIYDGSENKQDVMKQLEAHVERFSKHYF